MSKSMRRYPDEAAKPADRSERVQARTEYHDLAGMLALGMVGLGIVFAVVIYYYRGTRPGGGGGAVSRSPCLPGATSGTSTRCTASLVRPTMIVARASEPFDLVGSTG